MSLLFTWALQTDGQTDIGFFAVLLLWDVDKTIKKVSALSEKKTDRQTDKKVVY